MKPTAFIASTNNRNIMEVTMSENNKNETSKKKSTTTMPVKVIREGAIAASIWKRQAPSGFEYYEFTLSRSWKAQSSGREGYSQNFFARNADELQNVIREAAIWIEGQQASLQTEQPEELPTVPMKNGSANGKADSHSLTY